MNGRFVRSFTKVREEAVQAFKDYEKNDTIGRDGISSSHAMDGTELMMAMSVATLVVMTDGRRFL